MVADGAFAGVREVAAGEAYELLRMPGAVALDVRERHEWDQGFIPGAVHVPLGDLAERAREVLPDRSARIVAYCAAGQRSLLAAETLQRLGYDDVVSLSGGVVEWTRHGYPAQTSGILDDAARQRYARHVAIPEVGEEGQARLLESSVLVVGAGGLGSPAALYLAAAGVGRLGIVDADVVDASNLQRQVIHSTIRLGEPKADSARRTIESLNPGVDVVPFEERLDADSVDRILRAGWDVVVDGADNFPTRYLLSDAAVWHGLPLVHGSIYRFEGQVTVLSPGEGPCYRCLFPAPPPPELAPSCAEGGVLGVLPAVIGSLQAAETLKLLLGLGDTLVGRLLLYDALAASFAEVAVRRDPDCAVCGARPTITEYQDYAAFCAGPAGR